MTHEERTETLVVGVPPERRQKEVRKRAEFGWILTTAHEEAVLKGSESRKEMKLVFTRTGSEERLAQLKSVEQEWDTLMKSVSVDERGRIVADRRPVDEIPRATVGSIALGFGGLFTALAGIVVGVIVGSVVGGAVYMYYRAHREAVIVEYSKRVDAATAAFSKRQREILNRARSILHTPKTRAETSDGPQGRSSAS